MPPPTFATAAGVPRCQLHDGRLPDEFAAVVIGAGYGHGLGVRTRAGTLEISVVDDLPTVAAVARALLNRH